MSECASEGGREMKKKSALSPESQSCMEERRVSRKKNRLVPQIPAHHISFPSDESC